MANMALVRGLAIIAVVVTITGCGFTSLGDGVPGGRRLVFPVANQSPVEVILSVAEDPGPDRQVVGNATPDHVPAGAVVDVAFDVPPGRDWGIFVNPGPDGGWYIVSGGDVPPGVSGEVPLRIDVGQNGEPSISVSASGPGWFGN